MSDAYYAEYDEDSALYCVFNVVGMAVASFSSLEEAEEHATDRNDHEV